MDNAAAYNNFLEVIREDLRRVASIALDDFSEELSKTLQRQGLDYTSTQCEAVVVEAISHDPQCRLYTKDFDGDLIVMLDRTPENKRRQGYKKVNFNATTHKPPLSAAQAKRTVKKKPAVKQQHAHPPTPLPHWSTDAAYKNMKRGKPGPEPFDLIRNGTFHSGKSSYAEGRNPNNATAILQEISGTFNQSVFR